MKVTFRDADLKRLEIDAGFDAGLSDEIIKAYRKRMQQIRAAVDERDFYGLNSLRFEKLKGARNQQRSMRLNDQWRLIVEIKGENPDRVLIIIGIEDYH